MRTTDLRFDELHSLSRERYEEYFDVMPISKDQKTDKDTFYEVAVSRELRPKKVRSM